MFASKVSRVLHWKQYTNPPARHWLKTGWCNTDDCFFLSSRRCHTLGPSLTVPYWITGCCQVLSEPQQSTPVESNVALSQASTPSILFLWSLNREMRQVSVELEYYLNHLPTSFPTKRCAGCMGVKQRWAAWDGLAISCTLQPQHHLKKTIF